MKRFLASFLLLAFGITCTLAANCATETTCTDANFATGTCTVIDGTCTCTDPTTAACTCTAGTPLLTNTVCKNPAPTSIDAPAGKTLQVLSGSTATVTCSPGSAVLNTDFANYAWYLGTSTTPVAGENAATYTIPTASLTADTVVRCNLIQGTHKAQDSLQTSATVTVLAAGASPSPAPTFTAAVTSTGVNANGEITATCTTTGNLPQGATIAFKDEDGNQYAATESGGNYTLTLPQSNPQKVTCGIPNSVDSAQISSIQSSQVTVPASGLTCSSTSDCSGTGYTGACETSKCVCDTGYWAYGTACKAIGRECSSPSDCTGTGYAGTCTSSRCDCATDYSKVSGECISSATIAASSLFLLALAAIISRLF